MKLFLTSFLYFICEFTVAELTSLRCNNWITSLPKNESIVPQRVRIPRVIHHIYWKWAADDGVDRQRRMRWDACRRTCLDKMATYDSILWDDVMIEDLMERKFAWLRRQYHEYDYEVQRSDVAR